MPRQIREANFNHMHDLVNVGSALRAALQGADEEHANCPALAKKIRSALKSWEGAKRHMEHRISRTS